MINSLYLETAFPPHQLEALAQDNSHSSVSLRHAKLRLVGLWGERTHTY